MTRIMRDSTTLTDVPTHNLDIIAVYLNGHIGVATPAEVKAHAPHAAVAWIDVNGSAPGTADILDVETGDADEFTAVIWAAAHQRLHPSGYPPVIYCNRSKLTPVFNAMNAHGMHVVRDFRLWVATLDGTKTLADMTGVTAVQWKPASASSGPGHYDESAVYDAAWLASPAPPAGGPFTQPTQPGDTFAKIAFARNTSIEHLAQVNADVPLADFARHYLTTNP